jgi:hypothetical protein
MLVLGLTPPPQFLRYHSVTPPYPHRRLKLNLRCGSGEVTVRIGSEEEEGVEVNKYTRTIGVLGLLASRENRIRLGGSQDWGALEAENLRKGSVSCGNADPPCTPDVRAMNEPCTSVNTQPGHPGTWKVG